MDSLEKIEWTASEYEERERSGDWFWALGIAVFAASAAATIYGNYFFAALIILSGGLLGYLAIKKPDLIHYELNEAGVKIESRLYPYENIKSFWLEITESPKLFIKTERVFMPVISLPLENALGRVAAEELYQILASREIPEEEMRENPAAHIMEYFGF